MKEETAWVLGGGCLFIFLLFSCVLTPFISFGCKKVNQAVEVVDEETNPHVLLKRYEWFKDVAAQLDSKLASIQVYEGRFSRLKKEYAGKSRSEWSREDREQANLWEQEVAGIKASYNSLSAQYNAAMAKENYRFCEIGKLPPGADRPLPREYKPYIKE